MIIKPIPIDKPIEETEETLMTLWWHSEDTLMAPVPDPIQLWGKTLKFIHGGGAMKSGAGFKNKA